MESEGKGISSQVFNTVEITPASKIGVVVSDVSVIESIPAQSHLQLETFLTYVFSSFDDHTLLPFAAHLKKILGKTSSRSFAEGAGLDHSTLLRLIHSNKAPKLTTVARIIKYADLSDEYVYQIVADSASLDMSRNSSRLVFSDEAPVLSGRVAEQIKVYRHARGLSQRILAEKANIDHATISRLESEEKDPYFTNFARIVFALGLNAEQIHGALHAAASSR